MKISKLNMLKMNKRMQSTVSLRSIPGTSTTGMTHHVKGYQKDISPDANILHHGINDLKNGNNSEKIATEVNLALTKPSEKTKVFISGFTIRNENLDKIRREVNKNF